MKIVVLGDIHGRDIWQQIFSKNKDADHFIFLGDYFTSREGISVEDQITNFKNLVVFKDMLNHDYQRVILLRGNHDMEACKYHWAECSPSFRSQWAYENRDWFLENTQWLYVYDNIVFSHAGLTTTWMQNNNLTSPEQVNELEPSEVFGFTPCKFSDYYGDSVTQPPTWIRPWGLIWDAFKGYNYVVGHTTREHVMNLKQGMLESDYPDANPEAIEEINKAPDVWCCDTLGSKEYLIIQDGKFIPTKLDE